MRTLREIQAALAAGHGRDEGADSFTVRVRHVAGHRSGDAVTDWWGNWPHDTAEAVAAVLAAEYGGTVTVDAHAIYVVSRGDTGGRPPVGPLITLRMPPDLWDRLGHRAKQTHATRSALLRRGAELALATDRAPAAPDTGLEMVGTRLPKELIDRLDTRKRELGTTRSALLRHGAEMILEAS